MRRTRSAESRVTRFRLGRGSILAVLAVAAQVGCTREFYREWANMDVSETIFEKSRDPRWRLDLFSIEPPALSRFADPYDPEVPPAPPDDPAAEALSPVPQWPDNRLLVPVEGTGYLDLLEYWQRQDEGKKEFENGDGGAAPGNRPPGYGGAAPGNQPRGYGNAPASPPAGTPRPPDSGSPFASPPPSGRAPATPDMRGPQAGSPAEKPGSSASPAQTVIRMQDAPLPEPDGSSAASANVAGQSVRNRGTNAKASTPISLTRSAGPAATSQIPPPRQGGGRAFLPRSSDQVISMPPPRSGGSSSSQRPGPAQSASIPPPRSASAFAYVEPLRVKVVKDRSVAQASLSSSAAQAQPSQGAPAQPQPQPAGNMDQQVPRLQPRAPVGNEQPRPGGLEPDTPDVPQLSPRQLEDVGRMQPGGAEAKGLAEILVAVVPPIDEAEAAGLPRGFKAYRVGMAQCWLLALMNSRFYQFNLEALYGAALPVTLQRFYFEPQFYAGMSPVTGVPTGPGTNGFGAGFPSTPGVNTSNNFTYATRFSPGGQVSTLNLGTVAGFGKLFSSGGQLLMGFANEVAFNFIGKNPQQPTVLSALPISFVQPLLKGGGRAVTLEPLTLAERNLLYQVRLFALFRQEFFVVTLTAGAVQNFGNNFTLAGFSSGISGNVDPVVGFIPAVQNIAQVEIDRRNVQFYENLYRLYGELIQGEASGLTPLQVDQVLLSLVSARQNLFQDKITYRNSLDQFKMQMGLPPDTPMVLDMHLFAPFFEVFDGVDRWQKDAKRTMDQLPTIISKFPVLEDIDVEGRSVLGLYRNYDAERRVFTAEDENPLEDELQAAVRIALEYRLDLMNQRGALYDAWRQIRVTANALKGVLNVALTNNIYTPPGNTNPFAFLSEAKQFALTLNAELPLVRLSERNNFRMAIISYQRARRTLQNIEDNLKIQLRGDLRAVHLNYINYEINKRVFELNVRLKDQAFEQIVAPPAAAGGGNVALAATQTTNLLGFQGRFYTAQIGMTTAYQAYEQARLIVYRDIGTLPYDEWEAFSELFPSEYNGPLIGQSAIGGPRGFTPPSEAVSATPASR